MAVPGEFQHSAAPIHPAAGHPGEEDCITWFIASERRPTQDPAEAWEIPFTEDEGGSYFRNNRPSHPRTPRLAEDIPLDALESLRDICGIEGLNQVFIIPLAVRTTGWHGQKVISPNSVLAIGNRAVGLWTEKPHPGVKIAIPLEKLAAIEDVTILLYGRLSFLSLGDRLTIRYNTVAREGMEPALLELRKRLAGPAQEVPPDEIEAAGLPYKWSYVLGTTLVRLEENTPVVSRFASVRRRLRRAAERGQLLALNPFELVYVFDPVESMERYGEDSFTVPRARMTGVRIQDEELEVSSNGVRFLLSMAPPLREAAIRWCG
ncbi:MAG: hypothetical protein ABSF77_13380 [Spirochaetia bacterium]|jgi:CRP-like cAMP-binding protein